MASTENANKETRRERPADGGEASVHLVTATLFAVLAVVAWYVAVERPRVSVNRHQFVVKN
jgi:hypothetical protein